MPIWCVGFALASNLWKNYFRPFLLLAILLSSEILSLYCTVTFSVNLKFIHTTNFTLKGISIPLDKTMNGLS